MNYTPPLREIRFSLTEIAGLPAVAALPGYEEATPDLVESILLEAANIASNTLAPLNRTGDKVGSKLVGGKVVTPAGWNEAWRTLVDGGWNGVSCSPKFGGMGLPHVLELAVSEMWQSANLAFALCPMLTQGAVNAVALYGSDRQKALYLPNMVSGNWTGTMNLTEPQAGSDLAAVRTRALPAGPIAGTAPGGDNGYMLSGQKIFITYGDHDLTENIIHLVLARLPDAPAGVKGISLFIVPKHKIDESGAITGPNDVTCASLEHKMGIHGSPTAVLVFGENGGAWGELVGEPNRGLEYMFAMMNHARLNVGLQGLSIAERAYQQARDFARQRIQGRPLGWTQAADGAIVHHPDVRRMLLSMKSRIEAMRGLLYEVAAASDIAHHSADPAAQAYYQRKVDVLTPIAKGWCTETGVDIASLGMQVHGGMGYIEETGAAQHLRDARITTIYEGTTGIQANDLVGRKLIRDKGAAMTELLASIDATVASLQVSTPELAALGQALAVANADAKSATAALLIGSNDPRMPFASAVPYLNQMGILTGANVLARGALAAHTHAQAGDADGYYGSKLALAQFYASHVLPQAAGYAHSVRDGSPAVFGLAEAHL